MSTGTITSETVCAEARGEAARRAEEHHYSPDRAATYRALTFEPVSEFEFRAQNTASDELNLMMLALAEVEQKLNLEFVEHFEGNGSMLLTWRPAS